MVDYFKQIHSLCMISSLQRTGMKQYLPLLDLKLLKLISHSIRQYLLGQIAALCPSCCCVQITVTDQQLYQVPLKPLILSNCALQGIRGEGRPSVQFPSQVYLTHFKDLPVVLDQGRKEQEFLHYRSDIAQALQVLHFFLPRYEKHI